MCISYGITCGMRKKMYLCNVFFIVLDLRLTKGWVKALTLFFCPLKKRAFLVCICLSPSITSVQLTGLVQYC